MSFSLEFLVAVVDTLLPGLPATDTAVALPPASQVGGAQQLANHLETPRDQALVAQALTTIIDIAGSMELFNTAGEEIATAILKQVEQTAPVAFQALLFMVAADYYETAEVLRAFGWPSTPPQPQGYPLPPFNEALLQPVKKRPPLWRQTPHKSTQ